MHRRQFVLLVALALFTALLAAAKDPILRAIHSRAADSEAHLLPNGWRITPAGRQIPLRGDMVLKMILAPDGKTLIVNTGGFHDHGVALIDTESERILASFNAWKDWAGMSLDAATGSLFVSGGSALSPMFYLQMKKEGADQQAIAATRKHILRFHWSGGSLSSEPGLNIPGLADSDRYISGIIAGPTGVLYAANIETDTVYRITGEGYRNAISARVGYRPYALALSPDGGTLAVSNWGQQSVSVLDSQTLAIRCQVAVGSHPSELVYGRDGRLWVACSGSNSVSVLENNQVIETIKTSIDPVDPVGSTPDALAVAPDGKTLYVANADNNDVAVVDITRKRDSRVEGLIPTGWYPTALAISADGKKIFVGIGKGLYSRPNTPALGHDGYTANSRTPYDYIGRVLNGAVSVVDVPAADQLQAYTRQVIANRPSPHSVDNNALRIQTEVFSKVKHVLYIIRENRTYDQVFGDLGVGRGDPNLTLFGAQVTPNAHRLAHETVVLDNIYCNGEVSEDGHQWCNAAYATDFTEKAWPNAYSRRGEPKSDERLTASPAGYLWDNCARHNLSYRSYGEFETVYFDSSPDQAPEFIGKPQLQGHTSPAWDKVISERGRDTERAGAFIADLKEAEKSGDWPSFIVMHLGEDHTEGLSPGRFTPVAHVASNDLALGRIVDAVSHSRFWANTAIFVIEDDAQNGPDHVDCHRTVALVLSPYVKREAVDSTMYSTASMIRTMELMLGLPPMTQYDTAATPMFNSFTTEPDQEAFNCVTPPVDLQARNPKTGALARASERLDFSGYDRANPEELNRILWAAMKGDEPLPPPVHGIRP